MNMPPIVDMGAYERQYRIFVNDDATGANDGTSWTNAYISLQDALAVAVSGDQIWVAAGTYRPSTVGDRNASFVLKDGVAIYGGFAGSETQLSQRNWTSNVTLLSGDLNGDDRATFDHNSENSFHVVIGASGTTLDGFTISGGNASEGGGGIDTQGSSPILRNLLIRRNMTANDGGGIYNNGGSPSLTNVTLSGNMATYNGGGIYDIDSNTSLTNVTLSGNQSDAGGGIAVEGGSPRLSNVTVSGNQANGGGGLMFFDNSSPTLMNVTVSSNTATNNGGGLFFSTSSATLANVTIGGNTAGNGGGVFADMSTLTFTNTTISGNQTTGSPGDGGGAILAHGGTLMVVNGTVAGNSTTGNGAGGINAGGPSVNLDTKVTLENTIVADNTSSTGTPDLWGSFVSGGHNLIGDVTGSSGITGGSDGDLAGTSAAPLDPKLAALANNGGSTKTHALLSGSPAINDGDNTACPTTDQRGYTRVASCDMGAYEYGGMRSVNRAPTLDQPQNLNLLEDAGAQVLTLTGIDAGDAEQMLVVTALSSNPALIPTPSVSYTSLNASGSLSFTPVANAYGTATITVRVQDDGGTDSGGSDTLERSFTITVSAVNDAPDFTVGPNQVVQASAGLQTVVGWASGFNPGSADEASQTLLGYTIVSNSAPELFSIAPAIDASGTLTYTPKPGASGTATISVVVHDSGGTHNGGVDTSAVRTCTITVSGSYQVYLPFIQRVP